MCELLCFWYNYEYGFHKNWKLYVYLNFMEKSQ